jgi:hypothetical protein
MMPCLLQKTLNQPQPAREPNHSPSLSPIENAAPGPITGSLSNKSRRCWMLLLFHFAAAAAVKN